MMELFKFSSSNPLSASDGVPILNYQSAMWIERYRDPGEFEIKAQLSSGLKDLLPIGSIISHADTLEFAIVENQEIQESLDQDPLITITGRTFDSFIENRIVGANLNNNIPYDPYFLPAGSTAVQVYQLLYGHIVGTPSNLDTLSPYLDVSIDAFTSVGDPQPQRFLQRQRLSEAVNRILAVDDLGIKTQRRNPYLGGAQHNFNSKNWLLIHDGVDRSNEVIFSWVSGELESISYLFSNKDYKNTAVVVSNWFERVVNENSYSGYDNRYLLVEAYDIDDQYETIPTDPQEITDIYQSMTVRGLESLAVHNEVNIVAADVSKLNQYKYRVDYDIGDIISIDGSYGNIERRRVVEHVEIEDENGDTSYPTLAIVE